MGNWGLIIARAPGKWRARSRSRERFSIERWHWKRRGKRRLTEFSVDSKYCRDPSNNSPSASLEPLRAQRNTCNKSVPSQAFFAYRCMEHFPKDWPFRTIIKRTRVSIKNRRTSKLYFSFERYSFLASLLIRFCVSGNGTREVRAESSERTRVMAVFKRFSRLGVRRLVLCLWV